jgi:hypothetical protein
VEERQSAQAAAQEQAGAAGLCDSWLSAAEECLAVWLHAEERLAAGGQQAAASDESFSGTMVIDSPRPSLLSAPPGAVHRTLPPLLLAEAAADGSGAYRLRRRTSGNGRRDKRQSVGRRRAISEFSVRTSFV